MLAYKIIKGGIIYSLFVILLDLMELFINPICLSNTTG